jgi:hypothetical protein
VPIQFQFKTVYVDTRKKMQNIFLLFCNPYFIYRNRMLPSLALLNMNRLEINVDTLLFGNDFLSDETNCEILFNYSKIY